MKDNAKTRRRAAELIKTGGVVGFRTDTFYGLGADPLNQEALGSLRALKGREDGKPILVVVSDAAEVSRFVAHRTKLFEALSRHHWPGALTLVATAHSRVPPELTAGTGTIGLRWPDDKEVCAFIRACGGALTATSANRAGEQPARSAKEVAQAFPEGLALVVDGGAARTLKPSTVLDVSGEEARLIREGAVSWSEVQETLSSGGQ